MTRRSLQFGQSRGRREESARIAAASGGLWIVRGCMTAPAAPGGSVSAPLPGEPLPARGLVHGVDWCPDVGAAAAGAARWKARFVVLAVPVSGQTLIGRGDRPGDGDREPQPCEAEQEAMTAKPPKYGGWWSDYGPVDESRGPEQSERQVDRASQRGGRDEPRAVVDDPAAVGARVVIAYVEAAGGDGLVPCRSDAGERRRFDGMRDGRHRAVVPLVLDEGMELQRVAAGEALEVVADGHRALRRW